MSKNFNKRLRELDSSRSKAAAKPPPFSSGSSLSDEPPLELAALILFTLIGMLVLAGLAAFSGYRNIENDIQTRTERLLASAGMADLDIDVSGLNVGIVGAVDRRDLNQAILQELPDGADDLTTVDAEVLNAWVLGRVQRLNGVGEVDLNVIYELSRDPGEIAIAPDALTFRWTGGAVVITGTLSNLATVDAVLEVAEKSFSSVDAEGLTVREGIPSETDWLSTITNLVSEMSEKLPDGEIIANPDAGVVKVSHEFETRQEQRDVRDQVEDILAAVTFDFSSGLTVKDQPVGVTQEQVDEVQETLDELIEGKVVEFEFDSAVITPVGTSLLDEVLDALRRFPEVPIEVGGHTDNVGSPESNLELSRERAEAVLAYLVANGEDPARFVVVGYGEDQPVASNETDEGRARNRRIEFKAFLDDQESEEE